MAGESTQQRLANLEATLEAHFRVEEEDKQRRREDRLELNQRLESMQTELTEIRNLVRVGKLLKKAVWIVAGVIGGLVGWIANLLAARS